MPLPPCPGPDVLTSKKSVFASLILMRSGPFHKALPNTRVKTQLFTFSLKGGRDGPHIFVEILQYAIWSWIDLQADKVK